MKKIIVLLTVLFLLVSARAWAASPALPSAVDLTPTQAEASPEARPIIEVKEKITEPQSLEVRDKLEAVLNSQPVGSLGPTNFLKILIRMAVENGVSANTIVLVLLLPLIGALVGILQYFVGLSGFGMFIPAMLAVAFLSTGVGGGLLLFGVIVVVSTLTRRILRPFHFHYWPRRAIILSFTSLAAFIVLLVSPSLGIYDLTQVSIFPILFYILLSEEFTRTQLGKDRRVAISLTAATIVLAILGAILMGWETLQRLVLLNPEASLLIVLGFNVVIGRYSGFRILEYRRFYPVLKRR